MRLSLFGGLAALLVSFPLLADDKQEEKSEVKKDRKEQFSEIKEAYGKQQKEFSEGMKGVKTREQYMELIAEKSPKAKDYLPKLIALIEENPKDDLAFDMLVLGVSVQMSEPQTTPQRKFTPEGKKVFKLLADVHATNPKMVTQVKAFFQRPIAEMKPLFEAVLAKNEDREAKAFSAFALANMAYEATDDETKTAEQKKVATAEAEKFFEIVAKDYADVSLGKRNLGDMAKRYLFDVRNLQVGKTAPEVSCENLDGKTEKLSEYKGKVVVLDIWATWCGPCKAMIPHEREMVERLKEKPFALVSISADAKKETLTKFLETEKMPWNHWWAGNEEGMTKDWNVRFYPTIYVIDAKGVIRYKNIRGEKLEEAVNGLIKEAVTQ